MPVHVIRRRLAQSHGRWIEFQTPLGWHRGVVEQVGSDAALVRVPRQYAPVRMVSGTIDELDVQLLSDGENRSFVHAYYGNGYGNRYGYGYGNGWWGNGWWWWWIPFWALLSLAFWW